MCPGRYGAVYRTERFNEQEDNGPEQAHDTTEGDRQSAAHAGSEESHARSRPVIQYMKWGLIPSFSKEQKMKGSTFNCRDDSLTQAKSIWSGVKQRQRCIVVAEGYYEWQKRPNTNVPHYIKRKDGELMSFAGLWDYNNKGDNEIYSFTIITTHAAKGMEWLHDRMPVIVDPGKDRELIEKWLDPELKWDDNVAQLIKLLAPFDASQLEIYQVSSDVGKIHNNYPSLNQPLKGTITNLFGKAKKELERNEEVKKEGKEKEEVKKEDLKKEEMKEEDLKKEKDTSEGEKTIEEEEKIANANKTPKVQDDDKPKHNIISSKRGNAELQKLSLKKAKKNRPPSTKSGVNSKVTSFFKKK